MSLRDALHRRRQRMRFERLLAPCLDGLYRFACQLERDPVSAEDLLQQALVTALDRFDQLREDAAFRAWVSRIVYRSWQNRRSRRAEVLVLPHELERRRALAIGPDAACADRRLGARISQALDLLPANQAEAVWLVDGMGLQFSEAAEVLGVRPGTVASRVARARAALRADLIDLAHERGVLR
ncbi:MAG: sigma-70 family RNA polymerase sigma factor [Alphaproteobacteria bacterium]|nr:sigma-70 family RNA polymerase sigma factor [Alphaproteobacteria bacterium]